MTAARTLARLICLLSLLVPLGPGWAAALDALLAPWPDAAEISRIEGRPFPFDSASPFALLDVPNGTATPHRAAGRLFLPVGATAEDPVPAVILLHGARGVSGPREITYARQYAAMGLAALVVDVFASRRDRAASFQERLIEITESMVLADAFAAQKALVELPEVDPARIVLIGFSYGGMATLYAAHDQVARAYRQRFGLTDAPPLRAHVAYYAPCIARFEDPRATGAPVLMLWGDRDELIDETRCRAIAQDLRDGGTEVEIRVFEGAYHQWDGGLSTPWRAPRGLAACDFTVDRGGRIRGALFGTPFRQTMSDSFSRKLILALCTDTDGYLIGTNGAVRSDSNAVVGDFLKRALR